jgi:hypothetical protein
VLRRYLEGLGWPAALGTVAVCFLSANGDAHFFWFWRFMLVVSVVDVAGFVFCELGTRACSQSTPS